ncbi:nucleolar MIF4G domain-containing protein 1 [Pantherophis guttatus]|uniref:Nucleolar MIF4G domain-containing protein 1 n=1 Tax=Pantherophis guttatus TaxID=94885 RepID=A0A6P9AH38_PANGU|nr:nucleolar MIF4G domain-containing protein 1 [Pantherophis guttatus]
MKREACSSSAANGSQAAGRRGGRRRPPPKKQPPIGKLHKLGLSVRGFVEAAVGPDGDGDDGSSTGSLQQPAWIGRRNRREMKREKRKLKRGRRKRLLIANGEAKIPRLLKTPSIRKRTPPPPVEEDRKEEEKKKKPPPANGQPPSKQPRTAPSATAATRKRALLAANEAEEREIRRLERQLGLHKRRKKQRGGGDQEGEAAEASLPQSFVRDGLDYVLGALKSEAAFSGLYENGDVGEGSGTEEEEEEGLSPGEEGEDEVGSSGDSSQEEGSESPSEERESSQEAARLAGGFSELKSADLNIGMAEKQNCQAWSPENPNQDAVKYVPPQMRISEETIDSKKKQELERLKKTVKGLINRLSESNLASISGQLEELYMTNSRKDMNETLTDILICACVMESTVPSRLLLDHVLLVSVLHQTVGIEVGAHFLEIVVRKFDDVYKSEAEGKECENLLILIANLYNFYVVHSALIFDILKKLLSTFSGKDIELILLLLKNVGFSLRKDDALGLRELINEVQIKADAMGKQFQDQSRVCFMLEIMLALKNNDLRKIPGYDPEPIEKLRKLLRTLTHNSSSGKESQLRVSLESLLTADRVGRWWIVGSSWSGAPMIDSTSNKTEQILTNNTVGKVSTRILKLSRKQRMNTDIRRNIFCILMTSEDFLDAFEKLLKLRLKDQQEREIVHILIDCCLQEKTYNPFYAYLSAKFCEYEKRFQVTLQFSIWDKIRDLGSLSAAAFSNLVNLVTYLLKTKWLSLTVFKVIEFSDLDKPKVQFLRQVLSALFLKMEQEDLNHIFEKLSDNPKLGMLNEGLKLFLMHFLMKNIQAHSDVKEGALLKEKIDLVTKRLKANESKVKL